MYESKSYERDENKRNRITSTEKKAQRKEGNKNKRARIIKGEEWR